MKSKSLSHDSAGTQKQNSTFDFVNLYKSASDTSSPFVAKPQTSDVHETTNHKLKSESPKREKSPKKRKKTEKRESIDVSHITIDGLGLNGSRVGRSTPVSESKVTSTPLPPRKLQSKYNKVKSIMKNSVTDDTMDGSNLETSTSKPKKRNKSVSFMLGDNDEVVIKKTKSDESTTDTIDNSSKVKAKKHFKKAKKDRLAEKENKIDVNQQTSESEKAAKEQAQEKIKLKHKKSKTQTTPDNMANDGQTEETENVSEIKKKRKRPRKLKKPDDNTESKENTGTKNILTTNQDGSDKSKKLKKKKQQEKPTEPENEEPVSKSRKKDSGPDVVAELENLSIGDNAHTLTNLLDDMTVVDKDKRKKLKQKFNKKKKDKGAKAEIKDSEKTEEAQEKVKWSRRKWNKEGKADDSEGSLDTTVIVDNIPLSMLFSYKKILAEHFVKYGLIRSIGIAEVYPTEVSKPVFTTTLHFYSDGAATQALEDETVFEGSRVRVRRPLPPTATTLVVRSYGALTVPALSSMFSRAGRVRNIQPVVKGKHAMATYFIELDGPESVERALSQAADTKFGGKKVYVSRFELRTKTKQKKTSNVDGNDADHSEDSQD